MTTAITFVIDGNNATTKYIIMNYRMKPNYIKADQLEVGKFYSIAPIGRRYFIVESITATGVNVFYPIGQQTKSTILFSSKLLFKLKNI
jgi:hypothetical protein